MFYSKADFGEQEACNSATLFTNREERDLG